MPVTTMIVNVLNENANVSPFCALHSRSIYYRDILDSSRTTLRSKGTEGTTAHPKSDKVRSARSEQRRETRDEARRRKESSEARSIVYSFSACGPSSECRYGPRAGTITEPTNAGIYAGRSRMLMPSVAGPRCAQRDPWIGKYLESAEKYLEYICTCM